MKRIVEGNEIKLTANDYCYKNGEKISEQKVTPLNKPAEVINALNERELRALQEMLSKRWTMC